MDTSGWHQSKSGLWYNPNVCKGMAAHIVAICHECNESYFARKHRSKDTGKPGFCSRSCKMRWQTKFQDLSHLEKYRFQKGQLPHNYVGQSYHSSGYLVRTDRGEQRQLEHRYWAERFLGRKLKRSEIIHHVDGDKTNNHINNLRLMTQSEHCKLHNKEMQMGRKRRK